jgi:hypothetical protein
MIIGAPRSENSILDRILDQHPLFSNWVEPYYIQDHHFRDAHDDELMAYQVTEHIRI